MRFMTPLGPIIAAKLLKAGGGAEVTPYSVLTALQSMTG